MQTIGTGLWQRFFVWCVVIGAVLVAVAPGTAQELGGRRPDPLPGSTPAVDGADRYHLSQRSFDEAFAHYAQAIGDPMSESRDATSGRRWAVFAYRSEPRPNETTRYTCVRISEGNPDNAVPSVLRELRGTVQRGYLARDRYDRIAEEYASVSRLFFRSREDFGGPDRSVDAELYRRYQNLVRIGMWLEPQILQEEMMRIARSGDEEALDELKEMMTPDVERVEALQTSEAIVDHWLECLDEIRAHADTDGFPLQIDLEHTILLSDDGHG
ncbi:MAG: hypothetical protein ACOC37_03150 [Spirochaetota bacterium]